VNQVPIDLLKPHPKNKEFFPDALPENIWQELVTDVRENGIINPLIVTTDYVVLAGHLRLEAAKEAGLERVPVVIRDVDPASDEAVELLIKDNLLRRHLNDMQVARLIRVLKERYGVKRGNNQYLGGASAKVAEALGLSERTVRRLDKLNELIPEFQEIVSSGRWNPSAASELACLSVQTQELLHSHYREKIIELTQAEAKELRRKIETEVRAETEKQVNELKQKINVLDQQKKELQVLHEEREMELKRAIADLQEKIRESVSPDEVACLKSQLKEKEQLLLSKQKELAEVENKYRQEIAALKKRLKELESRPQPEIVEKVVEKIVLKPDPAQEAALEVARKEVNRLAEELQKVLEDKEYQQASINSLQKENELLKKRVAHLEKGTETTRRIKEKALPVPLKSEFDKIGSLSTDLLLLLDRVLSSPDLDELAGMVRAGGVVVTGDPEEKLVALAGHFDAGTLFVFTVGVLRQLAVKAHHAAERLESAFKSQPHLKVVKREGGGIAVRRRGISIPGAATDRKLSCQSGPGAAGRVGQFARMVNERTGKCSFPP
jgi:ParB family chromosome partitioning protein